MQQNAWFCLPPPPPSVLLCLFFLVWQKATGLGAGLCRQRSRERRALMETTRAMQEHFNGASWDRKLGLTLAPPVYDHVVPGAPVPVKRKRKKYSA